jgi:hypothetical protein
MAHEKNYKQAHATIVEAPTQDIDVPSKTIGEEKKKILKSKKTVTTMMIMKMKKK